MTNDSRDWPRNRDTRINLFPGRSRSVGSFRSASMDPSTSRLREPRLSIGAGIRDLERRTAEVPTILRNNINSVIEELRPIMERARTNTDTIMSMNNNTNVSLASWLSSPHPPAIAASPRETNSPPVASDDIVIDMEVNTPPPLTITTSAPTTPTTIVPSPTQSAETANTNSNNGSGDEQDVAETQVLNVSNSVVLNTICKYLPFLILIFTKFIFDNIPSILILFVLSVIFYYYNALVKREVARQTPRSIGMFLFYVSHIVIAVLKLFYIIYIDTVLNLWLNPLGQVKDIKKLSELLWTIVVTDFILKLITVVVKMMFTLLPQKLIPTSKRGKWFLFIEASSQLYRGSVPIPLWLHYLLESYSGPQKVIGVFLSAFYMVSKGNLLMSSLKLWWISFLKVLRNVSIGTTPTKEQIASAGNLCSICHDEFKTPVLLECQHIFCEVCVTKWLDREQTCPLCRAKIADDPSWRDGSTTYFIQVF